MEYIVYCTTNTENNYIYIGVHQTINSKKFDGYIGCGVYVNMPSTYNKPKTRFQYAVKKYGPKKFQRKILKVFNNPEDAYSLEAELVDEKFLIRKDVYNQVLGGNGGDWGISKECYQYSLEGEYITSFPSMYDGARSVGRSVGTVNNSIRNKWECGGFYWSLEKVDKLDISLYQGNKIEVFQYSSDGTYECKYKNLSEAGRANDSCSSLINRAIQMGYKLNNKYFSYTESEKYEAVKKNTLRNTIVYQYSLEGEYLNTYDSLAEATRACGKPNNSGLSTAIKLGRTWNNFQWSLEKLPKMGDVSKKTSGKARKVGQYTLDGKFVKEYKTVSECKKEYSGCIRVLKGTQKQTNGFIFKYLS